MLEGLAAWVLNTYVGEYLENLNTDQLSIGLLQGAVELENLPLKKDALKYLDVPLEVKAGFVGKITLHIPVRRLKSEPWVISIDKLYLIAGPLSPSQYNEEKEKNDEHSFKQQQLENLEARWRTDRLDIHSQTVASSSWLSFGTSLVSNIVENLQLKVNDVHIRYEDDVSDPKHPFSFGITIQSLSAQSTDDNWIPKYVSRDGADMMRKLMEMQNFAIYWDWDAKQLGNLPMSDLAEALSKFNPVNHSSRDSNKVFDYILEPVSAEGRLRRNCSIFPLRSRTKPRIVCDLTLDKIPLVVTRNQYHSLMSWMKELERIERARRYRKWRPLCKVHENPKIWWKYAAMVFLEKIRENNKRCSKGFMVQRAGDIVLYVKAYRQHLLNLVLDEDLQVHKEKMEEQLTFEELKILREITMNSIQEEESLTQPVVPQSATFTDSKHLLARWFPGWMGWYNTSSESTTATLPETPESPIKRAKLDDDILDVFVDSAENNTLLKRDTVFAQLNFHLKSGSFRLVGSSSESTSKTSNAQVPLTELEFSSVQMCLESRLRSSSTLFHISLGGVYLRDLITPGTIYPLLVSPQSRERSGSNLKSCFKKENTYSSLTTENPTNIESLFELTYERRPLDSTADYRLLITTRALDMVYNPNALKQIKEFFLPPSTEKMTSRPSELQLTVAAKNRYEELKNQTKAELRQKWGQILVGDEQVQNKRCEIRFDISAPQIIIPESFQDRNTTSVVVDFGRLHFHNMSSKIQEKDRLSKDDSDENDGDEFKTPFSSPPGEILIEDKTSIPPSSHQIHEAFSSDITETALHERMYDRYALELCDLQILVGNGRDNWKYANRKGTSPMHVLDRFNISLQLERRIIYTADPQWPNVTLSGNLPKLIVHVNEQKIQALHSCLIKLSEPDSSDTSHLSSNLMEGTLFQSQDIEMKNGETHSDVFLGSAKRSSKSFDNLSAKQEQYNKEALEESKLLLMQFTVNQMSLEVQSRGRYIAELQVTGVKTIFTKRLHDSSIALSVHGLLLVDALQTFGRDFELLMASHKYISMDSVSGSLRDSEPGSPNSPTDSLSQPAFSSRCNINQPYLISDALSSIINKENVTKSAKSKDPDSPVSMIQPLFMPSTDQEALITIEFEQILPNSPNSNAENEVLQVACIQFNSLDIIANQETIVELLGFLKRVLPSEELPSPVHESTAEKSSNPDRKVQKHKDSEILQTRTEVTADFYRLNVLLLRGDVKDSLVIGRKVATVTLSNAKIVATVGVETQIQGSLGGLQLLDLTPEGAKHSKVLSVGTDPLIESNTTNFDHRAHTYVNKQMDMSFDFESSLMKAFKFSLNLPSMDGKTSFSDSLKEYPGENNTKPIEVTLRLASVCYTHSPRFFQELTACASDFQQYTTILTKSIKQAATEVALGIVKKGPDVLVSSFYPGAIDSPNRHRLCRSFSDDKDVFSTSCHDDDSSCLNLSLNLDIVLESPIIILPRCAKSSDVLIGHLGKITIHNQDNRENEFQELMDIFEQNKRQRMNIKIQNMNVYSMKIGDISDPSFSPLNKFQDNYVHCNSGTAILHDTTLELTIDRLSTTVKQTALSSVFITDTAMESGPKMTSSLDINGNVVTPLQVVFSKQQFEQVMETLDYLTDTPKMKTSETESLNSIPLQPSMSALKLDEITVKKTIPVPKSEVQIIENALISLKINFSLPELKVELKGDLSEGEQGIVNLTFQDFIVNYEKQNPHITKIEVRLRALAMQDLLEDKKSKHRFLMVSSICKEKDTIPVTMPRFISTSCPDSPSRWFDSSMGISYSLPTILEPQNPFYIHSNRTVGRSSFTGHKLSYCRGRSVDKYAEEYPSTPPPSPTHEETKEKHIDDALVSISATLVDRKCPEFETEYNSTNYFVEVNFNCLDTTINLQTWVMVLDFLGLGANVQSSEPSPTKATSDLSPSQAGSMFEDKTEDILFEENINSEFNLKVRSLTLILNKPDYELAKASISSSSAHVSLKDGNMTMTGKLGSMSVLDLTPNGYMYRERFSTIGQEALDFEIFKYRLVDYDACRENDMSVKIRMSSVRYIHTQRFHAETLAFCQHFNQLQDVLGRMRAAAAGKSISDKAARSSRISLNIHVESPVILIPHSAKSSDVLVAYLGNLTIKNTFLFVGSPGTIASFKKSQQQNEFEIESSPDKENSSSSDKQESLQMDIFQAPKDISYIDNTSDNIDKVEFQSYSFSNDSVDLYALNPMTQSVYGSLELDFRATDITPNDLSSSRSQDQSCTSTTKQNTDLSKSGTTEAKHIYQPHTPSDISSLATDNPIDPDLYICLLDCMNVELVDTDLYSAERIERKNYKTTATTDLLFSTFVIQRQDYPLLNDTCRLELQIERNLDNEVSHAVPDFNVYGALSSVKCSLDMTQYKLIRGILQHNFGESIEELQKPPVYLHEPILQTVLSGNVWTAVCIHLDLVNVTLELLTAHKQPNSPQVSLAQIDFLKSRLLYESFSDQSKDIDLVSQEILISDTRYRDAPVNNRPNVFTNILKPSIGKTNKNALQAEIHYRVTRDVTRFTILLNNMRVMGVFDWLKAVHEFLMTNADDPFATDVKKETENPLPLYSSSIYSRPTSSSLTVNSGIVTKRAPLTGKIEPPMELKLNITDTEFVVVENTSSWDSNAIILKSTAVLTYHLKASEKPLSCSLQSLEVFSCILGNEEDTALSIIDPVTVNVDLREKAAYPKTSGLLAATGVDVQYCLEVSMQKLNVRLSYNDMKLFLAILDSIPKQTNKTNIEDLPGSFIYNFQASQINKLEELGFNPEDCAKALEMCEGRLDDAGLWLTQNAFPVPISKQNTQLEKRQMELNGIEIRIISASFCLIDDCKDADIPFADITLGGLFVHQMLNADIEGNASFVLAGDYYNRNLSGWEPFLEPWKCQASWLQNVSSDYQKGQLSINITALDILNINITRVLIEQIQIIKDTWTEDYKDRNSRSNLNRYESYSVSRGIGHGAYKRRSPFVPFALKNMTGCLLSFATVTTTPTKVALIDADVSPGEEQMMSKWLEVKPDETVPFVFEGRGKIRHRNTHQLKIHQLAVKVDGWHKVTPVTVDKVGVYFRHAKPELNRKSSIFSDLPPARVVFEVTLEGTARKLVTVRSALMIVNKLEENVEVKLEGTNYHIAEFQLLQLPAYNTMPIPLSYVTSKIFVRPIGYWSLGYCNIPILWQHVQRLGEVNDGIRICHTRGDENGAYRFCVSVKRDNYPVEEPAITAGRSGRPFISQGQAQIQPGHTITLMPSVVLVNLLPYDLTYYMRNTEVRGMIRPGKEAAIVAIDISQAIELGLYIENFPTCKEVVIPPGTTNYVVKLRVYDSQRRLLLLNLGIFSRKGGSLKLTISAPYWLVNKSGLPLLFKQDSAQQDAAGQDEEHELARSLIPLLFSFADREAPNLCSMRVGRSVHAVGLPQWCQKFPLEKGVGVRQLHVCARDSRPDWVYNIGIDIRLGRGRYRNTHIVTFAPRYQLDNQTQHKLAFAQKYFTSCVNESAVEHYLSAVTSCSLPFHWPRLDLDQLLCVKLLDIPTCQWSGGFRIDRLDSFHINMRDDQRKSHFVRVEITLQGATFFIAFTDAETMPPPFRIDNFSEVPILYYQTKVNQERLKASVRPKTSVPYAWDEPTRPPSITCSVPGGSSGVYNMNVIGDGEQLCYENFIYIAFIGTFAKIDAEGRPNKDDDDPESRQLVLDVPQGTAVILNEKEPGKRSQLWRMTSTGLLHHEGSSPPRDPKKPSYYHNVLVLDIAGIASVPGKFVPLMLRKQDERRRITQTWHFLEDGRLSCELNGLYVQAKDGIFGLRKGVDAVLGPTQPVSYSTNHAGIPIEQAISRQRLRPGSGFLSVKVVPDGPTRVLQITDIRAKTIVSRSSNRSEWVVVDERKGAALINTNETSPENKKQSITIKDLQVQFHSVKGIGISLVNHVAEELVYVSLNVIIVEYTHSSTGQTLDGSIQNIQIDNQLLGAECPVILYVSPKIDEQRHLPAIHITAHKVPIGHMNAEIFKHLMVNLKNMTLRIEERLLWKLLQFAGFNQSDAELEKLDESETQRPVVATTSVHAKRYYFGTLKLNMNQLRLSMLTSSKLSPDLRAIKRKMGIPLIKFEDALVELDPFVRVHPFETGKFLIDAIVEHYTEEFKSQAAKILGAVDFLGNPLGFFNDVSEGVSDLIEGNVRGLFKNVAHGVSNSAAKVTSSLSDGLGKVTMLDDKHQEIRRTIRAHHGSSGEHLVAGLKGLGFGLITGLTSVLTQTYEGASKDGIEGFFTGLGKGLVGTVAKPAVGVLDFASGAASAVRDTSRSNHKNIPNRRRLPRCCIGPGGSLPRYSKHHAEGQEFLYILNENNYSEMFIAYEQLRDNSEDSLRVLITTEQVYFLPRGPPIKLSVVLLVHYAELYHCLCMKKGTDKEPKFYIELTMKADSSSIPMPSQNPQKRPQVRCDTETVAKRVAQQINYAKGLYDEIKHTLDTEETPED